MQQLAGDDIRKHTIWSVTSISHLEKQQEMDVRTDLCCSVLFYILLWSFIPQFYAYKRKSCRDWGLFLILDVNDN